MGITGGHWSSLEIAGDYWESLEISPVITDNPDI